MIDTCNRFYFVKDMNDDLVFSISDVWLFCENIFLLPAKAVVFGAEHIEWARNFFELTCNTGESWGGGIFSIFGWFVALAILLDNRT